MIQHHDLAPYRDRDDAALRVLDLLLDLKDRHPVILGIPPGAVPMARLLCASLGGQLDLMMAKRIADVGAVSEDGEVILDPSARAGARAADELERLALEHIESLRETRTLLTGELPAVHLEGRVVVIVDEGITTGATMCAAVRSVRNRGARRVIVAAPVAAQAAVARLEREGALVRVPLIPEGFVSVGQYYRDFAPVDDQTVHACFMD